MEFCECCNKKQEICWYNEGRQQMMCKNCHEIFCGNIYDAGYIPKPVFYGNGDYFFGIELETESDDNKNSVAGKIIQNPLFYCKEEESLDNGFEVVSHPFSWDFFTKNKDCFNEMLDTLEYNCCNSGKDTCGMHIHISYEAFPSKDILCKILQFFYDEKEFITLISERNPEKLNHWAKLDENQSVVDRKKQTLTNCGEGKYYAVNLNPKTVEIRIFQGTMDFFNFYKNIEFVKAMIDFTLNTKQQDINAHNLTCFARESGYNNFSDFVDSALTGLYAPATPN